MKCSTATAETLSACCELQDLALAKHCLHYIERVAAASAAGGVPAAAAACGDGSVPQFLRDALQLAFNVLQLAGDARLQVCQGMQESKFGGQ